MTSPITPASFRDGLIATLQQTVGVDLVAELPAGRARTAATAAARMLARLRVDCEAAPALASQQLEVWRELACADAPRADAPTADATTAEVDPRRALLSMADEVGRRLNARCADAAFVQQLSTGSSAETAWFKQVLSATHSYVAAIEQALPTPTGTPTSPLSDPALLRQRLGHYLAARYPQLPPQPVVSLRIIPGGRSKETALFELRPNDVLPTRLVLRRDIGDASTGTSVFGEFALLQALHALDLPVPRPIAAERDPAALGGGFILVAEVLDATVAGDLFPELNDLTRIDQSVGPDIARTLARLHSLQSLPEGVVLGGHHAAGDPLSMVRNFQALWNGIAHKPPMSVATELGFAWLLSHPLPPDRPRALVHGDVGFHNLMLQGGRLAALLDWELTHLGDPAEDMGYVRAPLVAPLMPWPAFVEAYLAQGGDALACEPHAVNWYSVWAHTRNSVYTAMLFDFASRGQRSDLDAFYPAYDFSPRAQHYLLKELTLVAGTDSTPRPTPRMFSQES